MSSAGHSKNRNTEEERLAKSGSRKQEGRGEIASEGDLLYLLPFIGVLGWGAHQGHQEQSPNNPGGKFINDGRKNACIGAIFNCLDVCLFWRTAFKTQFTSFVVCSKNLKYVEHLSQKQIQQMVTRFE